MTKTFNVLITDDQPESWQIIHDLLADVFRKLKKKWKPFPPSPVVTSNLGNFFVEEIERRAKAIARLRSGELLLEGDMPFDLAVIDINLGLGTFSGLDIIDKLRSLFMCNGIIIISGFTHDQQLPFVITNSDQRFALEATPESLFKRSFPDRFLLCRKDPDLRLSDPYVEKIKNQLAENDEILKLCLPMVCLNIDRTQQTADLTIAGVSYPIQVDFDLFFALATAKVDGKWWVTGDEILEIYHRKPRQSRKKLDSKSDRDPIEIAVTQYRTQLKNKLQDSFKSIFDNDADNFAKHYVDCIFSRLTGKRLRLEHRVSVNIE